MPAREVGQFTGPSDVRALQGQVKADLENVRAALQRCAASGTFTPDKTPAEWGAWQSIKDRAEAFLAESPAWLATVSQYERGERIQKELAAWHEKARALGCDAGAAPVIEESKTPLFSFAGLSGIGLILLAVLLLSKSK